MLQQEGFWNDLSPKLRNKIEEKVLSFGNRARVKFNISNRDPDPDKRGQNAVIFPYSYTLKPVTFKISDIDEDRKDKQKIKQVGIVLTTENVDGRIIPKDFGRIKILSEDKGIKTFDLTSAEGKEAKARLYLITS